MKRGGRNKHDFKEGRIDVYGQYGRPIKTLDALGQSTHTAYDLRGNVIKQYGATYPVWYEYDSQGRMIAMATTRDTTLNPATVDSLDNPSLDVTQWNYDPATGLLVQKLYDDGKGPSYTYTPDGKLATRTWARGIVTEYGYDAQGSLVGIDYSDTTPDVTYTYDRLARQLSAIAAGVNTNLYAYSTNTLDLVSETQNGVVINRSRDDFGRENGIALEADYDISYGYDTYGRFASVISTNSQFSILNSQFEYSYLLGSPLVSSMTASTGHAWMRSYEPNRNLIVAVTNVFDGNLISAFDYVNDPIGRRAARLDVLPNMNATTNTFGYNVRSEVTSAAMGTNTYGYVFDPIGNRITTTNNADVASYTVNALNQYTAISNAIPVLPVHDDDGNMLTNGVWAYTWDGENRLIGVSSNDVLLATYTYDHRSRRIGKVGNGTSQSFLYDGWNLIAETIHHSSFSIHHSYVWGLDLSGSLQGAGGIGGLLAVVQDSDTYYPAFDGNGNVMEYISTDGTIVAHYEYSPFGETVIQSGELADTFAFRLSTKYWEDDIKLYYYGFRFYSPAIGRWLNRDPIQEKGGINLVSFVSNNSFTRVDYLGMWNIPSLGPIATIATGVKLLLSLDELLGRAINTHTSVYDVKCSSDCRRKLLFESERREEEILEFIVAAASANFLNSFTTVKTFGRYKVQKYGCCCKVWGADTTPWDYKPDAPVIKGIGQWSLFDVLGVPVGTIKYFNKDTEMEKSRECKSSCKPTFEGWVI